MTIPETGDSLTLGYDGDLTTSIDLTDTGNGFVSEWAVTRKLGNDIQLIAFYSFPIFGANGKQALMRSVDTYKEVLSFAARTSGGLATPLKHILVSHMDKHAEAHLARYWLDSASMTKTERTAMFYDMLTQFEHPAPARVLADKEGIPARTIHTRVAQARKKGLLPETTQGKA